LHFTKSSLSAYRGLLIKADRQEATIADAGNYCKIGKMQRLILIVAYVVLMAFSQYIFELTHDWRPDQSMVPTSRVLFVSLALLSVASFSFSILWWLPAGFLALAFAITPLISGADFTLSYVVYAVVLTCFALALGWAARLKSKGS
jgi:hypothetical protein